MKHQVSAAILMSLLCVGNLSYAEEIIELDPVIITAQKWEKTDLDTPASVTAISHEQLKRSGATNLQQALGYITGIVYSSLGPNGAAMSSMTSDLSIRGQKGGTLVLLNGSPINWRGRYNLEDIPVDTIEKVEIVKGGGAVLYGSQGVGGVINIITKKEFSNSASVGVGNYGRRNISVTAGAKDFSFAYNYDKWGNVGIISDSGSGTKVMNNSYTGGEKQDFLGTYQVNDKISMLYNHTESTNRYKYLFGKGYENVNGNNLVGKARYTRKYKRNKDFLQVNVKELHGILGEFFYNKNKSKGLGTNFYTATGSTRNMPQGYSSWEKNLTYGYDLHKDWEIGADNLLLGTSYTREEYKDKAADYGRHVFAVYGQYDKELSEKNRLTVSGRETWTTGAKEGKNYRNFSGQVQYLHKLDGVQSLYASIGQSFVMPSFSNMYSTKGASRVIGNPNLKPERGIHGEIGWKKELEKEEYKVAFFVTRTKDEISFAKGSGADSDKLYAENEDTKNRGIEASATFKKDNGLSYHVGLTIQDPQTKDRSDKAGAKTYWDRSYGHFLLNAGITYQKDKWTGSLQGTYMWDRVMTPSNAHSYDVKPYLLTSFQVKYAPNKQDEISLSIENLLNRKDIISHTSSYYYATPTNYLLTYKHKL